MMIIGLAVLDSDTQLLCPREQSIVMTVSVNVFVIFTTFLCMSAMDHS